MRSLVKKENLLFLLYTSGFVIGWIGYLSRGQFILTGAQNILQSISFLCLAACATLLWVGMRHRIPKLPMTNFKLIGIIAVTVSMALAALPMFSRFGSYFMGAAVRDLTVIVYILSGPALGLFTSQQKKLFAALFFLLFLVSVYLSLSVNVNIAANTADRRFIYEELGSSSLYAFQIGIGGTAAMLLLYFLGSIRSIMVMAICSVGTLYWLYLSLILSKRQGLGEFAMVAAVLLCVLILDKGLKRIRWLALSGFALLALVVGFSFFKSDLPLVFVERLLERFRQLGDTGMEGFDRYLESSGYLDEASLIEIIFGRGIAAFSTNVISSFVIHIGWVNLIFKGGILLVAFYIISFLWNILFVLFKRGFPAKIITLFFPIYCMIQLLYAPVWGFIPSVFWLGLAFFSPEIFLASARVREKESELVKQQEPIMAAGSVRHYHNYR
jgi:hypothetical protein